MQPKGGFDPNILAFDTALPHCAAAFFNDFVRYEVIEEMSRGQAERLLPILEAVLEHEDGGWENIDLIAVGIGPGNFTGIRISVSAARGLALALGIPAIGVSMFEVMRDPVGLGAQPAEIVSIEGPRGTAYVQHFRYGKPQALPIQIDPTRPPSTLELPVNMQVTGFMADVIAKPFGAAYEVSAIENVAGRIAGCAEWRWLNGEMNPARPAPLYIRAADAAPPRDPAPKILA